MSSTESACLVTGYSYFPDGSGEYAASSPLKHEALIWNNINSKNDAKSYKQNKNKNMQKIWTRFPDCWLSPATRFLFSFYYPPLFMVGHASSADDKGKSVHTSSVMTFTLNFYSLNFDILVWFCSCKALDILVSESVLI